MGGVAVGWAPYPSVAWAYVPLSLHPHPLPGALLALGIPTFRHPDPFLEWHPLIFHVVGVHLTKKVKFNIVFTNNYGISFDFFQKHNYLLDVNICRAW